MKRTGLTRASGEARTQAAVKRCKARKCRNAAIPYLLHCSTDCGAILGLALVAKRKRLEKKRERMATNAAIEKMMTRRERLARLQKHFNAWVVQRDKDLPCISCGRHHQGAWHAGHYLSRGARPELATHPHNVHKQCAPCNVYLHGNIAEYRRGLIERIGLAALDKLEGPHENVKATIEEIDLRARNYAAAVREMKKGIE